MVGCSFFGGLLLLGGCGEPLVEKKAKSLGGWVGWCLPGYKMVKKAGVVPQAGGQPQVCYWVLRGALPKGEKVFWRPVRGILFTKIVENVVFPKK